MTVRKRNWIVAAGLAAILLAASLVIAASMLAGRLEPYARQQAVRYLSQRFDSDVQLEALHIRLPRTSPLRLLLTRGHGITARIEGQGLSMRLKDRASSAPLFAIKNFSCDVNLESLLHPPVTVYQILVDGMEIQVPPRGERPRFPTSAGTAPDSPQGASKPWVIVEKVNIQHAQLALQPRDPQKIPLQFVIRDLQLASVGPGMPMKYVAALTNPKPPGQIDATGTFGPWRAIEPGDTPLTGDYLFQHADLGVFAGIAGTLHSKGQFAGKLSAITAHGEASVPDFRLRMAGNPVPLLVHFTVLVDGTNGNTTLQPVTATLGSTNFTTDGGIIRHEANQPRAISLNVSMPNGNLRDVLRLATKGAPFMEGRLVLNAKIDIPPLTGKVREKLVLDGRFEVKEGKFLHSTIQNQIDAISKRARGQVKNPESDQVASHMTGAFHLENAIMQFRKLSFGIPGADIDLAGTYGLDNEALDFGGTLKLQATVSQMTTGWKKVLLKPLDKVFEKEGAGTFLRIRVEGTSSDPRFGADIAGIHVNAPLPRKR
jgi:hypothetical protein